MALERFDIVYYDEEKSSDRVVLGLWEFAKAQEKYGVEALNSGDLTAMTYACWWGAKRKGLISGEGDFESWRYEVAGVEPVSSGESPAPPGR